MRVPLYSAASTTSTPSEIPLIMRLRMGKFCGAAKVPSGNSETSAPPRNQNLLGQPGIFFRIQHVHPGSEHGRGLAFAGYCAAMRGGIDAAGHAAEDDQSPGGEIARQALGHAGAVRRGDAASLRQQPRGVKARLGFHGHKAPKADCKSASAERDTPGRRRPQGAHLRPSHVRFLHWPAEPTAPWPALAPIAPANRPLRVR